MDFLFFQATLSRPLLMPLLEDEAKMKLKMLFLSLRLGLLTAFLQNAEVNMRALFPVQNGSVSLL